MRIKIPVVIGKNRLRGNATGAMVDENCGDNPLDRLRSVLRKDAIAAGVTPTLEWQTASVQHLLKMYEQSDAAWTANKDGTVGHIFEASLPSGKTLLLGDARTLALVQ